MTLKDSTGCTDLYRLYIYRRFSYMLPYDKWFESLWVWTILFFEIFTGKVLCQKFNIFPMVVSGQIGLCILTLNLSVFCRVCHVSRVSLRCSFGTGQFVGSLIDLKTSHEITTGTESHEGAAPVQSAQQRNYGTVRHDPPSIRFLMLSHLPIPRCHKVSLFSEFSTFSIANQKVS